MIRPARSSDLPDIVALGAEFYALQQLAQSGVPFVVASVAASLGNMLANDDVGMLVIEDSGRIVGATAAVLMPTFYAAHLKIAAQMFFFVSKEYSGSDESMRLITRLEGWAWSKGAATLSVQAPVEPCANDMYERKGYVAQETVYVKALPISTQHTQKEK